MRRGGRVVLGLLILVSGSVAVVVGATAAGAGEPPQLTVTKAIEGTPPPGAQFVVDISCENATPSQTQMTFTGSGSQTTTVDNTDSTCTVTESVTAGAAVSYGCEITSNLGGGDSFCSSDQSVFYDTGAVSATVTVTNDFRPPPEPAAAHPVEAVARFTG